MSTLGAYTDNDGAIDNGGEVSMEENGERIETAELESRTWPENKTHNNPGMEDKPGVKDEGSKMAADEATDKELWMESERLHANAKRIANSDSVLPLATRPLMQLNPLCAIDSSQEQVTTPAREDEGDAAHRNQTFLLGCSVSTLKEMADCSRKLNQSPAKVARVSGRPTSFSSLQGICDFTSFINQFCSHMLNGFTCSILPWYMCRHPFTNPISSHILNILL